ncbi:MAG: RsbRD N-terminal domain-containing protein [Desulfobulbaceae bacterium]|nr:RsbRD N-terminal domain-containing protein [Desulfobulbaceae bacterium]
MMQLKDLLTAKKEIILTKWIDLLLGTYSIDAFHIFKNQKNRFANPVGFNVKHGLEEIYDCIAAEGVIEKIPSVLEELIRIRAVQEFTAADSISFIFAIKGLVNAECGKEGLTDYHNDWMNFEQRVDSMALTIFDLYMSSRERLHSIRVRELESGRHILTDGLKCASAIIKQNQKQINT